MRIGIFSDIHNDARAFRRALEEMQPVDGIFCAGDTVNQYRVSNETLDLIRAWGVHAVRGNHEHNIMSSAGIMLRRSGSISPDNLELLENLPVRLTEEVDGKKLVVVHISPCDPGYGDLSINGDALTQFQYQYQDEPDAFEAFDGFVASVRRGQKLHPSELHADILIVGNTHRPVLTRLGNLLVINPGSLGEPRDLYYPQRRTYAVLDTETLEVEIHFFDQPLVS